jgi:hypothetical protein
MRKIFIILSLLFSLQAFSQSDTTKYYKSFDYGWKHKRAQYDSALTVPKDTVNKNQASIAYKNGSFFGKDQFGYKPFTFQGSSDYIQNQSVSAQAASMWINARGHYGGRLTLDSSIVLGNLATDPTSPVNGMIYYNTTSNKFRKYVNGAWQDLVSSADAILNQNTSAQTASMWINGTALVSSSAISGSLAEKLKVGGSARVDNNLVVGSTTNFTNGYTLQVNGPAFIATGGTMTDGLIAFGTQTSTINQIASFRNSIANGTRSLWLTANDFTFNTYNGSAYSTFGVINNSGQWGIGISTFVGTEKLRVNGEVLSTKYTQTQPTAITAAATTTIDLATGNIFQINLAASITTLTITNATVGQYIFKFTQDATGGRTISWPASFKWSGGTTPTLSAANKTDIITATYDGTNFYASSQLNY